MRLRVRHRAAHEENRQSQREGINEHGTWYFGLTLPSVREQNCFRSLKIRPLGFAIRDVSTPRRGRARESRDLDLRMRSALRLIGDTDQPSVSRPEWPNLAEFSALLRSRD